MKNKLPRDKGTHMNVWLKAKINMKRTIRPFIRRVYCTCLYGMSQGERSIFWEVMISVILRKHFIWTCVLFRTVSDIWRVIFSFSPTVIRHCLKNVNRCEASVGYCDCCWLLLIGPVISEDRMTGQNHLEFPQNELPELENVPLATRIAMYSQHDGAPPHYTRLEMQHLNDTFPDRWISRGSGHQDLQT
jgi:hypothetical protein